MLIGVDQGCQGALFCCRNSQAGLGSRMLSLKSQVGRLELLLLERLLSQLFTCLSGRLCTASM